MSFLGGAECSTSGNPLSQFTKHAQDEKSLQRDNFVGQGQQALQESFRNQRDLPPQDEALRIFLQQNGQIPQESMQPFNMENIRRDLEGYPTSQRWATQFNPSKQLKKEELDRAPEAQSNTLAHPNPNQPHPSLQTARVSSPLVSHVSHQMPSYINGFRGPMELGHQGPMAIGYQGPMAMGLPVPMGMGYQAPTGIDYQAPVGMGYQGLLGMGYGVNMGPVGYLPSQMPVQPQLEAMNGPKEKERMVELDDKNWEQEFAKIDQATQLDEDAKANNAIETELNDMDRGLVEQSITNVNGIELGTLGGWDWGGLNGFDESYQDPQPNYLFEQENPFNAAHSPYKEGLKIMIEGGNLSLAALAFEAAVQQDPQHTEAWSMLGNAQAQNEKETPAIRAYEHALKIDPSNLSALMGLAISYTNENYDATAYKTLERWLSVKYPQIVSPQNLTPDSDVGFSERQVLHKRVTDRFISAAQLSPKGEHMDPDVQVGLGVLFYGVEEHDKAVDCFEAALASHESGTSNQPGQLHLLWNRLGATLANSGRSEDAIDAYAKALAINPNFVRARFNLGVSCINLGFSEQAAGHLLSALSMHRVVEREGMARVQEVLGGNEIGGGLGNDEMERLVAMNQSTNLMETLRRVFGSMGRKDLMERVRVGMDVDSFRDEFDF